MESTIDNILDNLGQSSMFHLSLGSKELFHSNFLYWLSIIDWDVFMAVMRGLAGNERFWWEDDYCHSNTPEENSVEVRRESRNFDLSIYIRINKGDDRHQEGADEKGRNEIWVPVYILENKIKSLPRHEQLQEYVSKAFNDWKRGKNKKQLRDLWHQQPISFVLLSLYLPTDTNTLCNCCHKQDYTSKGKKEIVEFECSWSAKNYGQLCDILGNKSIQQPNSLDQQILKDYCHFIQALHELTQTDWKLESTDDFVTKVSPWALPNYKGDRVSKFRIDDIRQKILYSQMQDMLEQKLKGAGIEAKHVSEDKKSSVWFATNFAHNIGILEVSIVFPKGKDCRLFIQLQGNSYSHAFFREKDAAKNMGILKGKLEFFFEFDENVNTTENYPCSLNSKRLHPGGVNSRAKNKMFRNFKYYGDSFIYQNVLIPQGVSVEDVITAMVEDTKKCCDIVRQTKVI